MALLPASPALSMGVPQMGKREEGSMTTSYKEGGKRWKANWTTETFTENGVPMVRLTLTGEGLASPFSRDMKWESVAVWKAEDGFVPIKEETAIRDMSGKPVTTIKKTADPGAGAVTFIREDLEGESSVSKKFEAGSDLLIVEGIVLALRALPFGSGDKVKAEFLTNEPELYTVEFRQKGIETLGTPEGDIECYKVELVPELGLLGIFKPFFPKTYFWFTVAPPHRWVRYEGYENGLDSPEVIMEVDSFKTTKD